MRNIIPVYDHDGTTLFVGMMVRSQGYDAAVYMK